MRAITKGTEPRSLTEHRAADHASYDNFQAKDDLRAALVQEQRGLCCYCMGRVRNDASNTKIEHWQCQEGFPAQQLVYRNLLAACKGGEGRPKRRQHCDTRKGNSDIQWNPAEPAHAIEARVHYEMNGSISSPDKHFNKHLDDALNLNLEWLRQNRKAALDGFLAWLTDHGHVGDDRLRKELRRLTGEGTTLELAPYSPVPAWWIRRKLGR
jgi:uncharacterized protein (TIGR02646 family)